MSGYSTGPWAVCTDPPNPSWYADITVYSKTQGTRVCDLCPISPQQEADGRLIAAAPDLLDAVKVARDGFRAAKVEILANAMEEVIAKAEAA